MRIILATAAALLVASSAFAQSPTGAGNRGTQNAPPNNGPSATQGQNQQSMDHQSMGAQIQKNLQAAGFTDVQIMPSSFLVRAKDRDGNPVMMVINPDSVTAVTQMGGSQSQPNQGSTTGSGSPSQNPSQNPNQNPNQLR